MVKVFSEHPSVELVAVCDTNQEKVKEAAEHYKIKGYSNHKSMLEQQVDLDMVYVAVPPKWHHDIVVDAIRANKHILCEKPLANSIEEAANMLQLAKKANIIHAINFPINYLSNTRKFGELLESGYIGHLRRIELNMKFPKWPRPWQENDLINS
ncbi:putative dehydrogenase [Bacillus mesophilus]|uniref:Gfo/Idh/MocA family oxidoreductase n=1 Tax=Bacillus mesophilus TaxID=1808955 RepID=A0A6M0Q8N4_9BACI|nr:Gfo/Idh/MocA family oxidoreductase [Bacillus mesophilus]MBM7661909.1 putative dehydrogenase [Bacillus mesophilus]NEY72731.1 Gfo/Idh/MocA family oxidoreductase [Bacillus mesophilus]